MPLIRFLLLKPLSIIYGVITSLRNYLFDHGIKKSVSFPFPVICVGNITVGGTGKTPHVEYIARHLSEEHRVAVVSRGYMRKSKGFRVVDPGDSSEMTGDEPLQIARSLRKVMVVVDEKRVRGIQQVSALTPAPEVIVLDDAFQHRYVKPGMSILLTDYGRLMTRDSLMPYGRLRESIEGARRADIIIVTKTPALLSAGEKERLRTEISPRPGQSLFFTTMEYGTLTPLFDTGKTVAERVISSTTSVLLVTGIANPAPLFDYLSEKTAQIRHIAFRDHHRFSDLDISRIISAWESDEHHDKLIVTTEKDSVRLKDFSNFTAPLKNEIYYIPVRVKFIDNEDIFIKKVTEYAGKHS